MKDDGDDNLRRVASWFAFVASFIFITGTTSIIVYRVWTTDVWMELTKKHFPVLVGIPVSAVAAMFTVLVLKATSGAIEFKALGFEFRGASGPVVLWVICFLAYVLATAVLWRLPP